MKDCVYGTGILLDQCKGLLKACTVTGNKVGIVVSGLESGMFLDACASVDNRGAGIVVERNAAPKLQGCRFSNNKTHGVLVESKACPILWHCVMQHNESHGLAIMASEARVESCDFEANEVWAGVMGWSCRVPSIVRLTGRPRPPKRMPVPPAMRSIGRCG